MYPPLFLFPHSPLPLSSPLFSSLRLSLPFSIHLHQLLLLLSSPPLLYSLLPSPPHSSSSFLSLSFFIPPLFSLLFTLLNIRSSSFLLPNSSPSQFSPMFFIFPSCSSFSSCSFPLNSSFLVFSLSPFFSSFYLSVSFLPSASSLPPSFAFSSFSLPPIFLSPPSPAFLFPSFTSPLFPLPFTLPSLSFFFTSPSYNQAFSFIRRSRITVREN